jgi:hypothetical protein
MAWESLHVKNMTSAMTFAALLSAAFLTAPAMAADFSAGFVGNPDEASRDFPDSGVELQRGGSVSVSRSDEGATRDMGSGAETTVQSFTAVGRTADGDTVTVAPSENLERAVNGELEPADRGIEGGSPDPLSKVETAPAEGTAGQTSLA